MNLIAYCIDWHVKQSRAFYELLVEPLKPFVDIELVAWYVNQGDPLGNWQQRALYTPIIFCQRPPPLELLEIPGARLVWLPMWDNVALNWSSDQWWASLPKTLRVVAFSDAVAQKSQVAGLPTFKLHHFKNPKDFEPVKWINGRVLMYWNRTGLFGPSFLKKLCTALDIRELIFRGQIDPKITPKAAYHLPAKLGKTVVREITEFKSQTDYFRLLRRCNIYLAPRAVEGVGMTFLEAMASGCAVLAYDAPTMNEYITHGKDGYLFPATSVEQVADLPVQGLVNIWQSRVTRERVGASTRQSLYRVSNRQDWRQLEKIDWETLGRTARQRHEEGYALWKEQTVDYARFILDW